MFFDFPPNSVLLHFAPHTDGLTWRRVPDGFSGARVYRGDDSAAPRLALKAWPTGTSPERLRQIHAWLVRWEQLPFVPVVFRGAGRSTVATEDGRVWDCCRWMPGEPRTRPTSGEVASACVAVARIHAMWAGEAQRGPCPGVANRLRILGETEPLLRVGPGALAPVDPLLDPLLRRAVEVLARVAPLVARALEPWARHTCALHPCVRDLRGEHVLFDGEKVSGIIDYGAAAFDHAAVDLARLLGDYAAGDEALFAVGFGAYRGARPGFDAPDEFVRVLARAGVICSALGWLVRLVTNREPVSEPVAIGARLAQLLGRIDENPTF
jgi:homoserine kinase type II